jgi:tRNA (guanosine-2'-O-)-methyltransferase
MGSSKWLNLHKYNSNENNTIDTFNSLRKKGYRIVATTPHENDFLLEDLNLDSKIALVFGTELEGLSDTVIQNADEFVQIPMYGFTESFNISVSAAIILHYLTEKLKKSNIKWELSENEKTDIKLYWVRNVVKRSELLEKEFLKNL